jgi:hypothetical protein
MATYTVRLSLRDYDYVDLGVTTFLTLDTKETPVKPGDVLILDKCNGQASVGQQRKVAVTMCDDIGWTGAKGYVIATVKPIPWEKSLNVEEITNEILADENQDAILAATVMLGNEKLLDGSYPTGEGLKLVECIRKYAPDLERADKLSELLAIIVTVVWGNDALGALTSININRDDANMNAHVSYKF